MHANVCGSMTLSVLLVCGVWSLPVIVDPSSSGPFTGYQVLEIHLNNTTDVGVFLQDLQSLYQVDVWGRPSNDLVDVMVKPDHLNDVIQFLKDRSTAFRVKIVDVQSVLDEHVYDVNHHKERRSVSSLSSSSSSVTRHYLTFEQIEQFLQNVEENAPYADVTLSNLGRTFEGRNTPYVTIRQKNSTEGSKRVVVIEAGIHAREWIAPAMALNIIYRLAFNPNADPDNEQLLHKFDWIVVPTVNPDGYVYSHQNSSTRLWRKTRTTQYSNNPHCLGVDGNRNFGYEWSNNIYHGGNSNPCTENFSGPHEFSEPETRNVRSLLQRLGARTAAYISLHSYGQLFLYPWGYDAAATLEDEADMMEIGRRFSDTMWQRFRWYEVGSSAKVLYAAAGASDDYARGGAGIKYAFTVELSPADSSPHGFLLPAHHISSVVNDHWPAFKHVVLAIWDKINESSHENVSVNTDNNNNNNGDNVSDFPADADLEQAEGIDRGGAIPRSQETDPADTLTELVINGQMYRMDLNDPSFNDLIEHYIEFLDFRRHLEQRGGKQRRMR